MEKPLELGCPSDADREYGKDKKIIWKAIRSSGNFEYFWYVSST